MNPKPHILISEQHPEKAQTTFDPVLDWMRLRIRLRAQRRVLWLREHWQADSDESSQSPNFHSVVDNLLLDQATSEQETNWYEQNEALQALNSQLEQVETAIAQDRKSRYSRLAYLFGLNEAEVDLLQTCLVLRLNPQLERVFSYLQDHTSRNYVTAALVAGLFGHPYALAAASLHALTTWELVIREPGAHGEPDRFTCDPYIVAWLLGQNQIDEVLEGHARFVTPQSPLDNWPLQQALADATRLLEHNPAQRIRFLIQGVQGSGRKTFAACVARHFGQPLLVIDIGQLPREQWKQLYLRAQRMAYLGEYGLAWSGENVPDVDWPETLAPVQLQFLICEESRPAKTVRGVVDFPLEIPPLRIENRRHLWKQLVPTAATWQDSQLTHMVHRYKVSIGQIVEVAQKDSTSPREAIAVLRASTRHRLGKLAQVLECPFTQEDLALADNLKSHIDDFVFEARTRESLWERPEARRMFPQGKGLMALFTGSPGTGKTMAAQVIAAELELDLFRIDLSSVISKYIGETSKHIDQILTQARHMHAVLLFDEADTLFGKRTDIKDAHDRYANSDTNYLLQAIENYPGVAILASNKKSNIDSAFIRRLRYIFDFPKPTAAQRQQIWQQIVRELSSPEAMQSLDLPLQQLAERIELTGAQIKNAVLSAVFLSQKEAQALAIPHILRGIERELMKEGRHISPETLKGLH